MQYLIRTANFTKEEIFRLYDEARMFKNIQFISLLLFSFLMIGCGSSESKNDSIENIDSSDGSNPHVEIKSLVYGMDTTMPVSPWVKPALNVPYIDPAYNTTVQRVTDRGTSRFNRNKYSRIQSENSDGSYFFTYSGEASYNIYNTDTLELILKTSIHPDGEPQWHPTTPNIIRHLNGSNTKTDSLQLYETNVLSGKRTILADLESQIREKFPEATNIYDADEGSPSSDGNRYAWMVEDIENNLLGFITYDISKNKIIGHLDNIPTNIGEVDLVSITPSGKYLITSTANKYARAEVTNEGTYIFKADFSDYNDFTDANRILAGAEHSDIGINKDGNDVYIYVDFITGSINDGFVVAYDVETKIYTRLFELYGGNSTSLHISAKNYNKPGWVLISTYNCKDPGAWTCNKIFAVEIETQKILNIAHTYNCGGTYWQETQAVVNRDFSHVYFNSTADINRTTGINGEEECSYYYEIIDYGSYSDEVSDFYIETYRVDIPEFN